MRAIAYRCATGMLVGTVLVLGVPGLRFPIPKAPGKLAGHVMAQSAVPHLPGMAMPLAEPAPPPFYREWTFHVLVGLIAATGGVLAHRAWSRRRWRRPPAGVVQEAVLALDLVASTQLATHHGDSLAMRARNVLEERTLVAARRQGVVFVENTGDGCMMTFPSVAAALQCAVELLRDLRDRPPDLAPGPPLDVRAGVAYGEILLDARGGRHGAAINKAFRLMGLPSDAFVSVEGEEHLQAIPDRNRIFLDEEATDELGSGDALLRQVGVCRLKGFTGFHRVYEMPWNRASGSGLDRPAGATVGHLGRTRPDRGAGYSRMRLENATLPMAGPLHGGRTP